MKCPVCNVGLKVAERQGVEIDHCPQCRGVWLDRGELDKIVERSTSREFSEERREEYYEENEHRDQKKRRRGSFLGEMFDFG